MRKRGGGHRWIVVAAAVAAGWAVTAAAAAAAEPGTDPAAEPPPAASSSPDSAGAMPGPAPRPITLAQAVALAQQNAPSAVQAKGQQRNAAAAERSAYAAFLPSVSLSASATRQYGGTRIVGGEAFSALNEPWSTNGSIGASVLLFGGGQRIFELRGARATASAAGYGVTSQLYAVALDVKQQYFNVLAARESETAARAQLAQAELQLKTAVARVEARSATRSDSLRSEIQVRNAQLAVLNALTTLDAANAALTRSVGVTYPVTAAPADTSAQERLAVQGEALRDLAANGPAVQQAKAQLDAARAARLSSWTGYLPSVTASYSRAASGNSESFGLADAYGYSGSLRLSLSLPIWSQYQREQQIVQASVAQDDAEAALRDARLAAIQNFATALGAYRTAGENIAAQIASVAAAEEDLRVQQQRYAVGSSTLLDVLTSQTTLDQARQQLIRARYDQRVAKAQLEALVGRDL